MMYCCYIFITLLHHLDDDTIEPIIKHGDQLVCECNFGNVNALRNLSHLYGYLNKY